MLKKVILGSVLAAVAGSWVLGRDVVSYVRTAGQSCRQAIKAEVPIEFELQRARDMVGRLVPDIRKCMHLIAEEEVSVEHLQREIARTEKDLGKQKDEILALRKDLGEGSGTYKYAGRTYSSVEIRRDLAQRFDRFKTAEETVSSRRQILLAREKSVQAAREKLDGMLSAKRDLEVQIENLDARVKTLQAAQTASRVSVDDSQLSRARELISELNKQLDVSERMLDAEGRFTGVIPVDQAEPTASDLTQKIDSYFSPTKDAAPTEDGRVAVQGGDLVTPASHSSDDL